ncbi:hypothetical protein FALBO_12613 [Fusarium albosuccineum]|uniref:Knr4/Smi1-like domain-containing protein n=1 Tax=Fusarium albosuccineum TaxID=1237068 RepID=A0A8H4P7U2_9HYPO|nr:hypothetical protein FALBO_12613 [Fusarium albosuccineum]
MTKFLKFDRDAVLTDPRLPNLYHTISDLAYQFAALGRIDTAKTLISLLLSEYSSDWQLSQIRHLKFAFAETNQWPDEIRTEDRTEEALGEIAVQESPHLGDDSSGQDDESRLQKLLEHAVKTDPRDGRFVMGQSSALADALALAIRLASARTSSMQEIEADEKVQEALGYASERPDDRHVIQYLTERRVNWRLLSTGALARKIGVDTEKLDALAQEVVATFTERFNNGRKGHESESKSLKELLDDLSRNTKENGVGFYNEMGWKVPESLYVDPPATDEQISALEKKFGTTLPKDYKEFLKLSNGFGGTWNGGFLEPALFKVDEIDWVETYRDGLPLGLHETPNGIMDLELPSGREWPGVPAKAIRLGTMDIFDVWFISPDDVKKAIKAYKEVTESPETPDVVKQQTIKLLVSKYGSWEDFEKLDWVVMEPDEGESTIHGSFTQFLQARLRDSETGDLEEDERSGVRSIAHRCMADRP